MLDSGAETSVTTAESAARPSLVGKCPVADGDGVAATGVHVTLTASKCTDTYVAWFYTYSPVSVSAGYTDVVLINTDPSVPTGTNDADIVCEGNTDKRSTVVTSASGRTSSSASYTCCSGAGVIAS